MVATSFPCQPRWGCNNGPGGSVSLGEGAPAVLLFRVPYSRLHQLRVNEFNRDVTTAMPISLLRAHFYERERDTQSITRCSAAHHRDVRAVPRANRTFSSARNPIPCATSSTCEPPVSAPSRPWRSSDSGDPHEIARRLADLKKRGAL
jgi:hypothetical protein